jgi:hypothetical protein
VADLVGVAVGEAPGAAVQIDQRRERPLAARLVDLRQQRLVAVAEILDVLHVELVGPGVNGFSHPWGHSLVWVAGSSFAQTAAQNNRHGSNPPQAGSVVFR